MDLDLDLNMNLDLSLNLSLNLNLDLDINVNLPHRFPYFVLIYKFNRTIKEIYQRGDFNL